MTPSVTPSIEGQSNLFGGLAAALAKAQAEFPVIPRTKTAKIKLKSGGEYSYTFADLADILRVILPILGKHGIAFSQPLMRVDGKLYVVSMIECGNESLRDSGIHIPENLEPQQFGSLLSYYRRYGLSSLLGISTEEDTDAEPVTTKERKPKQTLKDVVSVPVQAEQESVTEQENTNNEQVETGTKPTPEEFEKYIKKMRNYGADLRTVGAWMRRSYNVKESKDLSKEQWEHMLTTLDGASVNGGAEGVLNYVKGI